MWLSANKPNKGVMFEIMKKTRNNYHYAVRKAKKQADIINSQNLFSAAQNGDIELLKEMKKCRNNSKNNSTRPDTVDGADNPEDIVEKFREVYSNLYNSAPSPMNEFVKTVIMDGDSVNEAMKITGNTVKEAAAKLKPGKSDISGSYTSDALLNGPDNLFMALASIFRSFLIHGTVTNSLLSCAFLPHVKSLKDPAKTDSYRAIAASSMILKLFDNVILLLWRHLLTSDSLQFGFKENMSTTLCTWLDTEVI